MPELEPTFNAESVDGPAMSDSHQANPSAYLAALEEHLAPSRGGALWARHWWAHTDIDHFQPFIRLLSRHTDVRGARVLDTGCGVAGCLLALRESGATDLVGIELDPDKARLARLRVDGKPIRIVEQDASTLGNSRSFDIVTSLHVVEHVADPDAYVQALRRLLSPDGVLLLACPNRLWWREAHSRLPFVHWLGQGSRRRVAATLSTSRLVPRAIRQRAEGALQYETDFTAISLRQLLQRNGLSIVELNPWGAWGGPRLIIAASHLLTCWAPPFHRFVRSVVGDQLIVIARAR